MLHRKVPPDFEKLVAQKLATAREEIEATPVAILIWGADPNSDTPLARVRVLLKDTLNDRGHLARFSEEMYEAGHHHSVLAQQVAHAKAFDVIFSIPGSPGSIAEIHDFAHLPEISHKLMAFLDNEWDAGYASSSLIQGQSMVTVRITKYAGSDIPNSIIDSALFEVQKLQPIFFMQGRRFH